MDSFGIKAQLSAANINSKVSFHWLHIDKYKRIVVREDNEIDLTYTEFEILLLLAQYAE